MTYEELANLIANFSPEQKQHDVTVEVLNGEFFPVRDIQETKTEDEVHGYVYEEEAIDHRRVLLGDSVEIEDNVEYTVRIIEDEVIVTSTITAE